MEQKHYKHRSVEAVDWDAEPEITGRVVEVTKREVNKEWRPVLIIEEGDMLRMVWHNAGLEDVFKVAEKGDVLRIRFIATVKLEGNRTFRKFSTALWTEGETNAPAAAAK